MEWAWAFPSCARADVIAAQRRATTNHRGGESHEERNKSDGKQRRGSASCAVLTVGPPAGPRRDKSWLKRFALHGYATNKRQLSGGQ